MKNILITGCSSGIGHCAAHGLKKRGYRVIASARRPADVQRLVAEGLEAVALDLDSSESIRRAVEEVKTLTDSRIDGLINNGAFGQPGAVEDLSREVLTRQFETNVFGTHELTCRILPLMRARGCGRIIQVSSVLGFVALQFRGAYNASKYALEGLTDTLRLELEGSGVHAVLVQPGPIESRFRENALAAYRRHIDPKASVHRDAYAVTEQRLTAAGGGRFTLGPEAVLAKIVAALESPRPRTHYRVTTPTTLFAALKRLLPRRTLDRLLRRAGT